MLGLTESRLMDNSILEKALSVVEKDKKRKLYISCTNTAVDSTKFMTGLEGVRIDDYYGRYVYKNFEWSCDFD